MIDKRIVNDWKVEDGVKIISQVNEFEIEMTNKVCTDWLKERTDQQEMSNASIALMEEAHYEVRKDDGKRNVYSFEMNGRKHSLHPFRGKQEKSVINYK